MSNAHCVVPENIHTPHSRGSLEIPKGRRLLKAKIFKGKYEPKLEFPEEWEVQTQVTLCGGCKDIFWNNTFLEGSQKFCGPTFNYTLIATLTLKIKNCA